MALENRRLLVIGAGLGRTGTNSFMHAMQMLFPGKGCHHMETIFSKPEEMDRWRRMWLSGDLSELRSLVVQENNVASCDFPSSFYYRELAEMFPEAKVVLTVHPKGSEGWYKSVMESTHWLPTKVVKNTWLRLVLPPMRASYEMTHAMIWDGPKSWLKKEDWESPEVAMRAYDEWNAKVKQTIPAERLLVFSPADGWEPLCTFLALPIPDQPYPRVNETEEKRRKGRWIMNITYGVPAVATLFISLVAVLLSRRRRLKLMA